MGPTANLDNGGKKGSLSSPATEPQTSKTFYCQFIIQTNKYTKYILIFYISYALLLVSVHLHHLQGVLTL